jgi:hypothetical protein
VASISLSSPLFPPVLCVSFVRCSAMPLFLNAPRCACGGGSAVGWPLQRERGKGRGRGRGRGDEQGGSRRAREVARLLLRFALWRFWLSAQGTALGLTRVRTPTKDSREQRRGQGVRGAGEGGWSAGVCSMLSLCASLPKPSEWAAAVLLPLCSLSKSTCMHHAALHVPFWDRCSQQGRIDWNALEWEPADSVSTVR